MVDVKTININIPSYVEGQNIIVNTADADITAEDVVKDKIAYGANGKVVGTHECSGGAISDGYVPKILSTELIGWDVYANEVHTVCLPAVERENVFDIDFHEAYDGAITAYGVNAFGSTQIDSFTIHDAITTIPSKCFDSCQSLVSITIPSHITYIGPRAFSDCIALANIDIPDSVTAIGEQAFVWCFSLASCTLSENIEEIPKQCFSGCYSLTSITIPANVSYIYGDAFSGTEALSEIHFKSVVPPTMDDYFDIETTCKIYVPTGSLDAYKSAENYPDPDEYEYIEE